MEIREARITFLVNDGHATIELHDYDSHITFAEVTLTAEQLCEALSRRAYTPCSIRVAGLDRVGMYQENKSHEFEIPSDAQRWNGRNRDDSIAQAEAIRTCPEGWEPDGYFGSQDSYYQRDGKSYAKCTIRRWTKEKPAEPEKVAAVATKRNRERKPARSST